MDWDKVDSTIQTAARQRNKSGGYHAVADVRRARTPLADLIAKDPVPDMDAMTEMQLCEYAAEHHVAVPGGLNRDELMETIREALQVNWEERLRGMRGFLEYVYQDGPHPLALVRRLIAITKAVRPDLLLNMSCAQLAVLCDDGKGDAKTDGRATVSARTKRLFEQPIKDAGMGGFKAGFQKTESAGHSYSRSAQGNQNRLGKAYLELQKSNGTQHHHHQSKRRAA